MTGKLSIKQCTANYKRLFFTSWMLLPGITTLSRPFLAIMYLVSLFWMFLGMNIIADIFMK